MYNECQGDNDMTEKQIRILEMTKTGVDLYSLPDEDQEVLLFLANDCKYCQQRGNRMIETFYVITEKGSAVLEQFYKDRNKEAEEQRHRRFQDKISIAQVLVPAVTFILGLIVEHFSGIAGLFFQLFR